MRGFIALLLLASTSVAAQPAMTGNTVYELCRLRSGELSCVAYVRGVMEGAAVQYAHHEADTTGLFDTIAMSFKKPFCISEDVSQKQIVDVVVQYLAVNAATRHDAAARLTLRALNSAFPCPSK